jgi:hypothetical protein
MRTRPLSRFIWSHRVSAAASIAHQGPEIQSAFAQRKPHPGRQALTQDSARRQSAPQHGLYPQRGLRPALGLRARGLGAALLRQLASQPQMAAPRTQVRNLCASETICAEIGHRFGKRSVRGGRSRAGPRITWSGWRKHPAPSQKLIVHRM